ncbi:hypothetical protein BLNAU_24640 [Blattamonas nauphoetae]|uniref:Uncharacterized protein n=1 Tax=Blattamonas nauphoetae TaxID=2049346 RepID=A0ABQ9WPQ7_9EUKA|nr:hypothetical protein BLNAU_24640 [Blattamonas nauphoetae]
MKHRKPAPNHKSSTKQTAPFQVVGSRFSEKKREQTQITPPKSSPPPPPTIPAVTSSPGTGRPTPKLAKKRRTTPEDQPPHPPPLTQSVEHHLPLPYSMESQMKKRQIIPDDLENEPIEKHTHLPHLERDDFVDSVHDPIVSVSPDPFEPNYRAQMGVNSDHSHQSSFADYDQYHSSDHPISDAAHNFVRHDEDDDWDDPTLDSRHYEPPQKQGIDRLVSFVQSFLLLPFIANVDAPAVPSDRSVRELKCLLSLVDALIGGDNQMDQALTTFIHPSLSHRSATPITNNPTPSPITPTSGHKSNSHQDNQDNSPESPRPYPLLIPVSIPSFLSRIANPHSPLAKTQHTLTPQPPTSPMTPSFHSFRRPSSTLSSSSTSLSPTLSSQSLSQHNLPLSRFRFSLLVSSRLIHHFFRIPCSNRWQ